MGKRRIGLAWSAFFMLLAASLLATGAEGTVTYSLHEHDGITDIEVITPLADYVFSEDGGVMKSLFITFTTYGSSVVELLPGTKTDPETLERQYVADAQFPFAIQGEGFEEGVYSLQEAERTDSGGLVITFVGDFDGVSITKEYTIDPDAIYTIDYRLTVNNRTGSPLQLSMLLGEHIPSDKGPSLHYIFNGEPITDVLAPGSYASFDGIGLMDKSIVFFLSPREGDPVAPLVERTPAGSERFGVTMTAAEGESVFDYSLYGGRRRYLLMEAAGLAPLDEPGVGARLMIPVIQFLGMLYRATGNYGWAIILFTILTRVVLFPLMRKQYHSMAKMQKIQPKLKRIQERFKDDRQLMQQKMMELYRKEGVNPMGGCLPMLVQLPILILIWRAILHSGELIHLSPGFLWVPDLSRPDPYFILVILTTGLMILQQWLMTPKSTGETAGGQKYFGYLFPLFMAVLLWRFPAGLWLYYLLTTGAQVGQQAIVNWEMARADAARPALAGDGLPSEEGGEDAGDEG